MHANRVKFAACRHPTSHARLLVMLAPLHNSSVSGKDASAILDRGVMVKACRLACHYSYRLAGEGREAGVCCKHVGKADSSPGCRCASACLKGVRRPRAHLR
eukprot:6208163-Pleurochrysis_carterae.AAC.1